MKHIKHNTISTYYPANMHFSFFIWPFIAISLWDDVHMILGALYGGGPKQYLSHNN